MDYLLGPRLSVALFYLMPIGLVTWNLGLRDRARRPSPSR